MSCIHNEFLISVMLMDKKEFYALLVSNIRKLRKEAGLTQTEIARRLGVRQATYSAMECGRQKIFTDYLPIIAEALGVKISDLFNETVSQSSGTEQWAQDLLRMVDDLSTEEKEAILNIAHMISKKRGLENSSNNKMENKE